jgi:hypothetical protein
MICPNCGASLLHHQRTRRRCSRCRAEFALEPKDNPVHLHDVKLRRVADRLSDGGALRYTDTQLWYATGRRALATRNRSPIGRGVRLFVVVGFAYIFIAGATRSPVWGLIAAVPLIVVLPAIIRRRRTVRMPMPLARFRTDILHRWIRLYGSAPTGLIDGPVVGQPAARARMALLCTDPSTAMCLYANGVPERCGVWLTSSVQSLPPGVPVLILHDASIAGYLLVAEARRVAGGRVVDLGVRPRSVAGAAHAVKLREKTRDLPAIDTPATFVGLTAAELSWLGKGWWSPLAALPPARLMSLVAGAVDRIDAGGDPDRRAARAVGFMTWPKP